MKLLIAVLSFFTLIYPQTKPERPFRMPSLFSDNMVLQQKTEVPVWGKDKPATKIFVSAGWGSKAQTAAGTDGSWKVSLKTSKAGGPYQLTVKAGDTTAVFKNVMLGEVWLCSGQSNMEMPLEGWLPQNPVKNSAEEIANADYPKIRFFTVGRAVSNLPEFNCTGSWSECSPQTAAKFSAAAYFFGRKLYKELHVPVGLIFSSWGGTKVQSWISGKYLGELSEYKATVQKIDSLKEEIKTLYTWIHSHPVIDISKKEAGDQWKNLNFGDSICAEANFNDSAWKEMKLPVYWESAAIGTFDGAVWFRKKVEIPSSWLNRELILEPGPIDDMDRTYVNGTLVGATEETGYWQAPREYRVPKDAVNDTIITIAIRDIDNQGGGGIWGNGVKMQIRPAEGADSLNTIPLEGEWKYLPVAEYIGGKFYVYNLNNMEFYSRPKAALDIGPNTPTMLFNGMIAPLIPYHIKGVIWYQGESNSDEPQDYNNYRELFTLMIKNWRSDWNEGNFPFYYVQIAPYSYGENSHSEIVRNAQFESLAVPNTGMAVTLDIGSLKTIHPPDKQDVGKRLALWALAKNYHKKVFFSGPLCQRLKIDKGKIMLSFKHAGKGLVLKKINGKTNFTIAGSDGKFYEAQAEAIGKRLAVFSSKVNHPVAVRYAWSNEAEATLFNSEGLPAPTFKTNFRAK